MIRRCVKFCVIYDVELRGVDEGVFVTLWFAGTFLCAVKRRHGVMLGIQRLWPCDACGFGFEGGRCVIRGRGMFLWLTRCCVSCAAWRRQHDPAQHTRFCFWFGQRGCDDCLGLCKICCDCFGATCCIGSERVHLIRCCYGVVRGCVIWDVDLCE